MFSFIEKNVPGKDCTRSLQEVGPWGSSPDGVPIFPSDTLRSSCSQWPLMPVCLFSLLFLIHACVHPSSSRLNPRVQAVSHVGNTAVNMIDKTPAIKNLGATTVVRERSTIDNSCSI